MHAAVLVVLTAGIPAQGERLAGDLEDLNVRHQTEHYAIAGTVSDQRLAEFGRCLEYIHAEYARGFGDLFAGTDRPDPWATNRARVIIFARPEEYDQFSRKYFNGAPEFSVGQYADSVDLLMIKDQDDIESVYETLFHEAFHQFIRRYMAHPPMWLNEGLATYYGSARPTEGGLVFDRPLAGHYQVMQQAIDARAVIPFDQLMAYDRARFYDPAMLDLSGTAVRRQQLCYAQAYTLIAFIVSDPTGPEHLRRYIRKLSDAGSSAEARAITREMFPPDILDAMVPGWVQSVRRG